MLQVTDRDPWIKFPTRALLQCGVSRAEIEEGLGDIDLVEGTAKLFEFIVENGGEIIIVSASFKANVECGLEGAGLLRHVERYTQLLL